MSTIEDIRLDLGVDRRLAARLKRERETRGWSLAELALRSAVSRSMISKIERGETSPTATLLGRLSAAFGLTLSQLFASVEGGSRLARAAEQPGWQDPENGFRRRSLSPAGAGRLELVSAELPPGAEVAYPATSYAMIENQQVWLLEGTLEIRQGEAGSRLLPGDCLHFGPPQAVVFRNPGPGPCRYLVALLRSAAA